MNTLNIRLGFATNSSSSHSLIYIPNSNDLDRVKEDVKSSPPYEWDTFILKSPEEKRKYFVSLVCSSIRTILPPRITSLIVKDLVGYDSSIEIDTDVYHVDHQSTYNFPVTMDLKDINVGFAKDFYDYVLQRNIVIVGGNDNESNKKLNNLPKKVNYTLVDLNQFKDECGVLLAKRQKDKVWTLFNINTGAKICVSFCDKNTSITKSRTPDLIDMKITNMCNEKCAFCYQNSTSRGKHAEYSDICCIIDSLAEMDVFEIAFGGGEPTLHPDFSEILKYTKQNGIIPNFSTRSTKWLCDFKMLDVIKKHVGAVGFSISSVKEIEDLYHLIEKTGLVDDNIYQNNKVYIQYVMGSTTLNELDDIMSATSDFRYPLVLLGYKSVGRGSSYTPYSYEGWINLVKKHFSYTGINIDTALAKEFHKELKENNISDKMYFTEEGKFSMYIDAVNMKMGPSSYCSQDKMIEVSSYCSKDRMIKVYNNYSENILETFKMY